MNVAISRLCGYVSSCSVGIMFMETLVFQDAQHVAESVFGIEDTMLELGKTGGFHGNFVHSGSEEQACQQTNSLPDTVEWLQSESDAEKVHVLDATEFESRYKQSPVYLVNTERRRSCDLAIQSSELLVAKDLASGICRCCMNLCIFVLIAVGAAQVIFLGAIEQKGGHDSSCLVTNGLSYVLWIATGCVSLCLCMWSLYGIVWKCEKSCSCREDMELSRSRAEDADKRAQKAKKSKQQFMAYVFHNIRGQGEDGEMELHMEEFDLLAVVKFLTWALKDLLCHKRIRFKMDIEPMVESLLTAYHVIGDKHRVLQTLGIFLSKAVKFTPAGGRLELEVKCEGVMEAALIDLQPQPAMPYRGLQWLNISGFQHSPFCCYAENGDSELLCDVVKHKVAKVAVSVKDLAKGISSQDRSTLFEPYSLRRGWIPKPGLSCSGLSMVKCFTERIGGYVGLNSKEGDDNMFCLSIPCRLVPVQIYAENDKHAKKACKPDVTNCKSVCIIEDDLHNSSYIDPTSHRGRNGKLKSSFQSQGFASRRRVLLVEDTEINRIILRKVLQNLNLHCEEAENGKVAVDYFKQGRTYDLVLMDKEMPIMDGHETTRRLRMMGVKTPIIALTGNSLQSDKDLFFEAGVDDFQTKPLSRDKLVQLLARYGVKSSCADSRRG